MSTHRSSRILLGLVGAATVAALVVPGAAFAKGKPELPGPGDEVGFNLSVPAVFVGSHAFPVTCDVPAVKPDGQVPSTNFTLEGYYYVQGENTWQAQCKQLGVVAATATAEWGDNLSGDAKLKVGSPIRVELGLFESPATPMMGWDVVKLEPLMLDREAPYGTLATETAVAVYASNPVTTLATRVWAPGTLKISQLAVADPYVIKESAGAEINATGKVVFGYNLRVPAAGSYLIEYTFPAVTITGIDAGDISDDTHTASLLINVGSGGGGGGGKVR